MEGLIAHKITQIYAKNMRWEIIKYEAKKKDVKAVNTTHVRPNITNVTHTQVQVHETTVYFTMSYYLLWQFDWQ